MVQRDESWVNAATPEQIVGAYRAGELAHFLGGLTGEETAQAEMVASTRNRVLAAAYGVAQGRGDVSSDWYEAKRRGMTPAQLEKLSWVESATPAEVYAAEQAGDLDHLLGRDVSAEQARPEAVRARVHAAMGGV